MRRFLLPLVVLSVLAVLVAACAAEKETVIVEKEVIVEVPVERIVTIDKEVPVERVVIEEVIREIEIPVERVVIEEVEVERIVEVEKIVKEVEIVEVEKIVEVEVEKVAIATPTQPPSGVPRFGGDLRIVSQASIATLDPVWSGFYVVVAVAQNMFETLLGWDKASNISPKMVDSWTLSADKKTYTFILRDGLQFHNGNAVTASDVKPSVLRWLSGGSGRAKLMREFTGEDPVRVVDSKTFSITMNEPYGGVIAAMAYPHRTPFVMPEEQSMTPVSEGVEEYIGSGVFKFSKWEQGHQVVLEKFREYVPRAEVPDAMVGGSIAYVDRVIWLEIPDEETKIAGLETGEWDVVDGAGFDFFQRLTDNPDIYVPVYKPGHKSAMHLTPNNPPFGNSSLVVTPEQLMARKAVQAVVNIEDVMLALGDRRLWILCPALYYCGTPQETFAGQEFYNVGDVELGKEYLAQSNYAGETLTLLNPTDYGTITPTGVVLKAQMESIGLKFEMPALDWATIVGRFANFESYHAFTDWLVAWCCADPISWPTHNRPGRHPVNEEAVELTIAYAQATDPKVQFELLEAIQISMYENVTSMILGQWFSIYPARHELKAFEVTAIPYYANVWLER